MHFTICICTCGRTHLRETLESVASQELPSGATAGILVIDNAPGGPARAIVEAVSKTSPLPIRYEVEPRRGLTFARNRTLEVAGGDWIALIDDDEAADPGWLVRLSDTAERYSADAVFGLVLPKFSERPPRAVEASRIFERHLPEAGTSLDMNGANTGNALVRRSFIERHALGFSSAFNTTGGEDSDFFRRFFDLGGRMVSARHAIVRELVPRERMTEAYVRSWAMRTGETYAHVVRLHGGLPAALLMGVRASANVAAAALLSLGFRLAGRDAHYHYGMLMLRNLGKLRYLAGARRIELYAPRPGSNSASAGRAS